MSKQINIELKGKEYTCKFGLAFIGYLFEELDLAVSEVAEKIDKNPFIWVPKIMYHSLKFSNENIEFTEKEFLTVLDDDPKGMEKCGKCNRAFIKSIVPKLPEEITEESKEPKKK